MATAELEGAAHDLVVAVERLTRAIDSVGDDQLACQYVRSRPPSPWSIWLWDSPRDRRCRNHQPTSLVRCTRMVTVSRRVLPCPAGHQRLRAPEPAQPCIAPCPVPGTTPVIPAREFRRSQ